MTYARDVDGRGGQEDRPRRHRVRALCTSRWASGPCARSWTCRPNPLLVQHFRLAQFEELAGDRHGGTPTRGAQFLGGVSERLQVIDCRTDHGPCGLAATAGPAAAENVLRYTSLNGGAVTMDPHSLWTPHNLAATMQVYEALLDVDSNLAIVPQLAMAWRVVNSTPLGVRAAPERSLPRRRAVHRRGRRLQPGSVARGRPPTSGRS